MIDIRQNEDDWKVIVARLISAGYTIQRVADFFGVSYFTIYFLVRRIQNDVQAGKTVSRGGRKRKLTLSLPRKSGRKLSKEDLKQVRHYLTKTNMTPVEIARAVGVRSTYVVYRVRKEMEERSVQKAGSFQPQRKTHVCPKHGRVEFSPCVLCAAENAKRRSATQKKQGVGAGLS